MILHHVLFISCLLWSYVFGLRILWHDSKMTISKVPEEHGEGKAGKEHEEKKTNPTIGTHTLLVSSYRWRWVHRDGVLWQNQAQNKTEALLQLVNQYHREWLATLGPWDNELLRMTQKVSGLISQLVPRLRKKCPTKWMLRITDFEKQS